MSYKINIAATVILQSLRETTIFKRCGITSGLLPPPPRYEEIFPAKTGSYPTDGKQKFDDPVEGSSDVNYEQEYLMAWTTKRKQLRNRMVFFFWLPVLLLAVSYFMNNQL